MAAQAAPKEKTRGEGPVGFSYIDVAGKSDYKRVPLNVKSVVVLDRKTKRTKSYDVSVLPQQVKDALVAFAFQTRAKTYMNNHLDEGSNDALKLADQVYADFNAGKVYSRAEGAKVGRVFDTALYVEAFKLTMQFMADKKMTRKSDGKVYVPLNQQGIAKLTAKIEGQTPNERTKYVFDLKKTNKYFAAFVKELEAKKITKDIGADDIGDMF